MAVRWGLFIALFFIGQFTLANSLPQTSRVLYGQDDRLDLFEIPNSVWAERAQSTVALIHKSKLIPNQKGIQIKATVYGDAHYLCASEPFFDQSYASNCSGTLVAPDIVMTAGHCVAGSSGCSSYQYVFNYAYKKKGEHPTQVGVDDVYSCKEVIKSVYTSSVDFALVRLDRPVVGRKPLELNRSGKIDVGTPLVLVGYPAGIPLKIAPGAKVLNTNPMGYFVTDTDSYGGNSGSAVFNETTGLIEGVLVRGEQDFVYKNGCYVSRVCQGTSDCRGEDVTRVDEIIPYL